MDEVLDSQIIAEQVEFLDNCFDNSFNLQSTLVALKEYVAEEIYSSPGLKKNKGQSSKTLNTSALNKTAALNLTGIKSISLSQPPKQNVINRNLKAWGLPEEIAEKYRQRGITEMFEWQVNCLANSKVLIDNSNLVYSAPTSAGKTLVAEILTIKTILERQKKVIIILPFVSIVREKMFYLQDIFSSSGIRVEGFMGSKSPPGGLQAVHVAICTIEKANSLVNRLLDDGNISDLGAVIVDELHLLGDPHRGYILELLLTKIKYVSTKSEDIHIQIVGMSATLPNLGVLANWLSAELFVTQFRPIPLDEYCLVGNKFFDKTGKCVSTLKVPQSLSNESDNVLNICLDTIKDSCSILIFCMAKNRCENLAQSLASSFYSLGCKQCEAGLVLREQLNTETISEVLEQLKSCPVGLDQVLMKTISFGVAYHHAGLTFDERDIIEGAFKSGAIRVLVATSTLSSGVNLPARVVIIRSPVFLRQPINILTYKQMSGRAGRMGRDTKGESILICTDAEKNIGFDLMMGALDPVKSCIDSEDKYMRAVLEMIASQVLCSKDDLDLYSRCTLLHTQQEVTSSQNELMTATLKKLMDYELVRIQEDGVNMHYVATSLGKACLSASMAPNDGLSLFLELQKARQCLVLETDLHLIYLVTPYSVSSQWGDIDWLHLLTLWESLTKAMKRVGDLVGVQESFIIRCLRGKNKLNNIQSKLNIHKRFYTALALQDLVNEVPLSEVAAKFQCARGFLQSLQQAAATFAGMVTAFCHQLGWKNMETLVSQFQDRLHFGIHSELLELMKLSSLNGVRARALFDAGFETISSIASADENIIENILHKAVPFQSEKEREDDDSDDVKQRNKFKAIWITGCCGVTAKEAAKNLIIEARKHLEDEIGVSAIKWNTNISPNSVKITSVNEINEIGLIQNIKEENDNECSKGDTVKESESAETKPRKSSINILENSIEDINVTCDTTTTTTTTRVSKSNKLKNISTTKNNNEIETKIVDNHKELVNTTMMKKNSRVVATLVDNCEDKIKTEINDNDPLISLESKSIQPESTLILENLPRTNTIKDEIIWDSLNFTDAGIENITKLKAPENIFSPNISFGDTEKSGASFNIVEEISFPKNAVNVSVKDTSLFSTDGETSIFEESLPLDLIPSKFFDNKISPVDPRKPETVHFGSTVTNTILEAFDSPLLLSEEEDIKLVYEDSTCENISNLSKEDEVVCSQNDIQSINNFNSPYKRRLSHKEDIESKAKKKKQNDPNSINTVLNLPLDTTGSADVQLGQHVFKCVVLKGNTICENHILEKADTACIYVCMQKKTTNKVIGGNILNIKIPEVNIEHGVKGIAICLAPETCVFIKLASLENKMIIQNVLKRWIENGRTQLKVFSSKWCYLNLKKWLDISLPPSCVDVLLTEWLIHSNEKMLDVERLMQKYHHLNLSSVLVQNKHEIFAKDKSILDACINAWSIWMIAEKQDHCLRYEVSHNTKNTENHVSIILAKCEYHGITVDRQLASQMLLDVKSALETLQKKADKMSGSTGLHLSSSKAVAKALGMQRNGKVSTKKSVLTCHSSPLASVVVYWRKLHSILTKTLYPLAEKAHGNTDGDKIRPSYTMHTCTGRISMHEPNLQNVPRTFSIPSKYLDNTKHFEEIIFNCRHIFKPSPGYVMVSADYCQLEMRVLTHFSEDSVLLRIMRSGEDVFKSIASSWSNLPEDQVDDDLRQKAKQLCYGILYGMGNRTLSQNMDVTELEAAFFMDSFYKTFPQVRQYTLKVVEDCRKNGYVETLMKRRRYLPDIKATTMSARGTAERQAVNTTIQGSAADIAKAAMCAIDSKTYHHYEPRLLLQMHDELIYEVPENYKLNFMKIMKEAMESTISLKVPLPVKVKCGRSWGTMNEVSV